MSLLISLPWHKIASVLWVTDSWTIVASSVCTFLLTHGRGRECLKTLRNYLKYFLLWGVCMCIQMYVGLEVCFLVYKCGCLSQSSHSVFVCLCLSVHSFVSLSLNLEYAISGRFAGQKVPRHLSIISSFAVLGLQAQLLCGCWRSEVGSCCLGNRYPLNLLFSPLETVYKQAFKSRCSGIRYAYFPYSCIQLFQWRQ